MTRDELRKLITGPICTLPTPMDDAFRIDYGRMAELTQWWVANGIVTGRSVLKVCAAMGEGPDLSDDEWPHLLRTVVQNAQGKAPVVCGLKAKNTLHTIADAKKAQDLGAIGLQIDLPLFHHSNHDDMVRFFSDISAAIDIGIMIYNTYWFGIASMDAPTMLRLKDAEHVVAIKWHTPDGVDYDQMREFAHIFNVIDNGHDHVRAHKNGARGYISETIAAYPAHDLALWDLLEARRYAEAQALMDTVQPGLRAFVAKSQQRSGGYREAKGYMAAMGHPVGPNRPPTLSVDDGEIAELRQIFRAAGWPVP